MIGRWLCNLGWHRPRAHGRLEGRTETFISPGCTTTIPYLTCQRCGREYIGTVEISESWRFPLDKARMHR